MVINTTYSVDDKQGKLVEEHISTCLSLFKAEHPEIKIKLINKKIFSYVTRVNLRATNEVSLQSFNYSGEGSGNLEDKTIAQQKLWRDTGGLIQLGANFLAEKIYLDEAHKRGKGGGSAFSNLSSGFLQPQTSVTEAGCGWLPNFAN